MERIATETRERLFFLDYAPVLVASALTGENVDQLFRLIAEVRRAARVRHRDRRLESAAPRRL